MPSERKSIEQFRPFLFIIMKHNYIRTLFAAIMLFIAVPYTEASVLIDGLYYELNSRNRTATVNCEMFESNSNYVSGEIVIPSMIEYNDTTYSVTAIGPSAFIDCSGLTSIIIPQSVSIISFRAFKNCCGLTSITIPNSVTYISNDAFEGCSGLYAITVESENSVYDSRDNCNAIIETSSNTLIRGCQNTIIPNSVTSIGYDAFSGCNGLISITIPNSVTSIGVSAFEGCSGLTSINIPESVTSICQSTFSGCSGLTSITIPNSVTNIDMSAFYNCSGLTSIIIPKSVTTIRKYAFLRCFGLTSITILNSLASIDKYAFSGCGSTSVTIHCSEIGEWCQHTSMEEVIIGDDVKLIGKNAFSFQSALASVIIGNGVTSIGDGAFSYCSGLTSITIGNSVTSIGVSAFSSCSSLTSINIPNSVTSIGRGAFYGCSGLSSIIIGNSLTTIGDDAIPFRHMTSIVVASGNPIYDSRDNCNAIIETSSNTLLFGCKNTVIPNGVTSIGSGAFWGCDGLTSINIPNSVTTIGNNAFAGCSDLKTVIIGNGVTSIGSRIFGQHSSLTDVYCYAKEVPDTDNSFYRFNVSSATLHVPETSVDAYRATLWGMFKEIVPITSEDGIQGVNHDRTDIGKPSAVIYGLDGKRLSTKKFGLNIIDGHKVLVK